MSISSAYAGADPRAPQKFPPMQSELDRLDRAKAYLAERNETGSKQPVEEPESSSGGILGKIKEKLTGGSIGKPDYTPRSEGSSVHSTELPPYAQGNHPPAYGDSKSDLE